ncbi:50S ribosomal protein L19e [Candidatus Woesearchaeota archaeon]|nr:50S ribosomal protein L19e [Candidatus Woesearchaeota archaeon]
MLKSQKRIAAQVLKCSPKKVVFDIEKLSEIKEAITKQDIKTLISDGSIKRVRGNEQSRARARIRANQRGKGRQRGHGSRKGRATARLPKKKRWINGIRLQRDFLRKLRDDKLIPKKAYRELYMKSKGGFFRSKRHLELYISEHGLKQK